MDLRTVDIPQMVHDPARLSPESAASRSRGGFTIFELTIALALAAVFGMAILMTADTTASAFRTGATVGQVEGMTRDVLQRISDRLESADIAVTGPQLEAPFHSNWIDFQRVTGYTAGVRDFGPPERITLEYSPIDPNDGVDNDGNGIVDDCRIVWLENPGLVNERRVILSRWIPEFMENEIEGNFIDDNGNDLEDERGLSFDFSGSRLTIRLTIQQEDLDGFLITRSLSRTLTLRNG